LANAAGRYKLPAQRGNALEYSAHAALSAWENFYVIVGSSAAALTGLQFVVIALVSESETPRSKPSIDAFGTPTIVHFCTVLLVSAILSAPWRELASVAEAIGLVGLAGMVYGAIVVRRAKAQTAYAPVLEDWIWHMILPLASHVSLVAAALALYLGKTEPLFAVAAVSLLLLFVGIHNAWDTVLYITIDQAPALRIPDRADSDERKPEAGSR
jgi:hypothetical protein